MSDRSNGPDLIPPYEGELGKAADLSAYLQSAASLCQDPRNWVSSDQWNDVMQQIGAALAEFCDLQLVKDDPRMQRLVKALAYTRDIQELSEAYDVLANYVAEVLTKIEASGPSSTTISRTPQGTAGRTRLVL